MPTTPTNPTGSTPGYLYRSYGTGATNYVLSATLEDDGHTVLTQGGDIDGTVDTTFNCADTAGAPRYCLQP